MAAFVPFQDVAGSLASSNVRPKLRLSSSSSSKEEKRAALKPIASERATDGFSDEPAAVGWIPFEHGSSLDSSRDSMSQSSSKSGEAPRFNELKLGRSSSSSSSRKRSRSEDKKLSEIKGCKTAQEAFSKFCSVHLLSKKVHLLFESVETKSEVDNRRDRTVSVPLSQFYSRDRTDAFFLVALWQRATQRLSPIGFIDESVVFNCPKTFRFDCTEKLLVPAWDKKVQLSSTEWEVHIPISACLSTISDAQERQRATDAAARVARASTLESLPPTPALSVSEGDRPGVLSDVARGGRDVDDTLCPKKPKLRRFSRSNPRSKSR